ncbi:hypothetical protein B0T10DRAFT_543187, partial [Thelonectria olida]
MALTWLVTGTTSGIGEALVGEILARGDKVIASGRKVEERLGPKIDKSENLVFLELDITESQVEVEAKIKKAWHIFGSIDVLFNNAGCTGFRSAEEADDAFIQKMFQVNLFGPMHLTSAILPLFRAQGHGCVTFTSSSSVWAPLPFMGHYAATKAALSAYVESLHKEVNPMGIRCVAIECGGTPTLLGQPRGEETLDPPAIDGYLPLFGGVMELFTKTPLDSLPGDVTRVAARIVDIVKREGMAAGRPWDIRVPLGSDGWGFAAQKC